MSINLWRHLTNWLGGMGLIVLAVAILPLLGIGGRQMLLQAEVPGPMKDARMTPRIAETAKGLWLVYRHHRAVHPGYRWAGMGWFDAVCHTFSTVSLGAFRRTTPASAISHRPRSNTSRSFSCSFRHQLRHAFPGPERALPAQLPARCRSRLVRRHPAPQRRDHRALHLEGRLPGHGPCLPQCPVPRHFGGHDDWLRTTDYGQWPMFAALWMLFLCSFATSAGSTGGGIKMVRALLLYKQVYRELLRAMHPSIYHVRVGGKVATQPLLFAVLAFGFIYMVCIVSLTLVMSFTGLDIVTAFSAVVASINNTGPGLGQVGPSTTYAVLEDFQTWVCIFAMLLGRRKSSRCWS
jgi:trk system potassium uptake protein TrkH